MVRRDGHIRVLDFGLAKLAEPKASTTDTEAPTMAMVNTDVGTVMGTANYMSPEQAKGTDVDARTDLWSLGAVLYEMISASLGWVLWARRQYETYAMSGKRSEAAKVLAQLQELSSKLFVSPYYVATIQANLGQKDQAFSWLERSYEQREGSLVLLRVDPGLDSLRSDPRYSDLVRRLGLPQ